MNIGAFDCFQCNIVQIIFIGVKYPCYSNFVKSNVPNLDNTVSLQDVMTFLLFGRHSES